MMEIIDTFGPQVAIIDNNHDEIRSIEIMLDKMKIGNKFFEVDYTEPKYPVHPISTIQLVFLDLYYDLSGHNFDPYSCSEWLKAIVPENQQYILVIWSNDPYKEEELLKVIKETETPMPYTVVKSSKSAYQTGDNQYDIERLLSDLDKDLKSKFQISISEFDGQVIAIEDHAVLINCLIYENPPTFEVRRFDLKPFQGAIKPEKGMFLKIRITNRPGSKIFDFSIETADLSGKFKKSDDFADIGDVSFLKGGIKDDENNI